MKKKWILMSWLAPLCVHAVDVRTLAFDMPEAEVTLEIKKAGAEKQADEGTALQVKKNRFSKPIVIQPGDYVIQSKQFKGEAKLTLQDSKDARFLLIVIPCAGQTFRVMLVPDAPNHIGKGDRFLINACNDEVQIRFDQQLEKIKPGTSVRLKRLPVFDVEGRVQVEMARLKDSKWTMFNSTYWYDEPETRVFLILHTNPDTGYPQIHGLTEVL
jgi:hypothetical protein